MTYGNVGDPEGARGGADPTGEWGATPGGGHQYGAPGAAYTGADSPQGQPMAANRVEAKGFFSALFDFTFRSFITISFARVIYAILIVVAAASWLLPAFSMMTQSVGGGFLLLLFGWIPGLILVVIYRIALEVTVSLVRTSQNTAATREEIELLRRDLYNRA